MSTRAADKFSIPRLTVGRTTSMDSFVAMVNGQDTKTLRRDRMLSKGFTVVRRTRAGIRVAQDAIRPSARKQSGAAAPVKPSKSCPGSPGQLFAYLSFAGPLSR